MLNEVVFICSPLRGEVEYNKERCRRYYQFAYDSGFVPFAPHIFYTQFLDDNNEDDRAGGIQCGIEMLKRCDRLWVFKGEDKQVSEGMAKEIEIAEKLGIQIDYFNSDKI